MKKYQKPVLDAVEYEVEEILTLSNGGTYNTDDPNGTDQGNINDPSFWN